MFSLDQLLSRVVERKGFAVQGADSEALLARRGDEVLLAAWKLDAPLTADEVRIVTTAMEQVKATSVILAAPKGADAAAKELLASAKGVELWAESRLVVEIGSALLTDACEAHPASPPAAVHAALPATPAPAPRESNHASTPNKFPSLISQAASVSSGNGHGAAYYMPNKPKGEVPADMQATISSKNGTLGYAWGGATGGLGSNPGIAQVRNGRNPKRPLEVGGTVTGAAPASPSLINNDDIEITSTPKPSARSSRAAPAAAPTPVANADEDAYEIITTPKKPKDAGVSAPQAGGVGSSGCLRLNVNREEALAKAAAKPNSVARLTLVPHIAFTFDLVMERQGLPAPVTAQGALLVSSITGDLRPVDGLAWADAVPQDARKDAEKLQAVDIYEKVKSYMSKTFTRTMNVEKDVAGNTVMQSIKMTPDPEECGLEHKGMVLVPIWEVSSATGVVKVDGFSGATL